MNEDKGLLAEIEKQFGIENYNLIQDDENYYLFRALNNRDHKDIQDGLITDSQGKVTKVRTDLASYEDRREQFGDAIYKEDDPISLVQVIDHIKRGHRTDTNCISLSSNANVSVLYGNGYYHDEYVMIKVPKNTMQEKTFNASEYMLSELEKKIQDATRESGRDDVRAMMDKIDSAASMDELLGIVSSSYEVPFANDEEVRFTGTAGEAKRRAPVRSRFSKYPSLNDDQNLIKNKIVAKLTWLEERNLMEPVVSHSRFDTTTIRTLGMAISSSELLHYGEITEKDEAGQQQLFEVQKELIHMIGLLQQVAENRPELADKVSEMENIIVQQVVEGRKLGEHDVPKNSDTNLDKISIKQAYELCGGKLQYQDAQDTLDKIFYLSKSVINARQYGSVIDNLTGNMAEYSDVIHAISEIGLDIEPDLMDRRGKSRYKICESVSIPLMKHEEGLVQAIQGYETSALEDVSTGKNISGNLIGELTNVQTESVIRVDEYYARAIFSSYDWEQSRIHFSKAHEESFIKSLKERKISTIYETLVNSGLDENNLPGIIMNLTMSDRAEDVEILEALEQGKITDEIIEKLNDGDSKFQGAITVDQIEDYLDFYKVEGTDIQLKDYQQSAINNADKIFESHRFASVILPTGAGKSFVAIAELLKMQSKSTNGKILYLAPSVEILDQIMKYTEIYVHGEKVNKTRAQIFKEVFPNVELATYQSLLSKSDEELRDSKYSFIILDELHRTGAEKWGEKLKVLLEAQSEETKVLGITATPERDRDNRNMADEMAELLSFTREEIKSREHIAKKIDLVDAIRMGIVIAPKIVECEYSLKENTKVWEDILTTITNMDDGPEKDEHLRKFDELRSRASQAKGIPELFRDNIVKKDGRYIYFMPIGANDYGEDEEGNRIGTKSGADKVKQAEEKLKEWLKDIDGEPEFYSMLGEYGEKRNTRELNDFEDSKSEHIKVMIVMNKLNEGVHVRGINGIFWERALDENSKILALQELGRAIRARKDGEKINDKDRPVVIDLANNLTRVNIEKVVNSYDEMDDIVMLQNTIDWVNEHDGILPDINAAFREEASLARALKRIQKKYRKYNNPEEFEKLDGEQADNVGTILEMGYEIDLWDTVLPDRIVETNNKGANESDLLLDFSVKGLTKEFEELVEKVNEKQTAFETVMKWAKEHGRMPKSKKSKEESKLFARWNRTEEKKIVDDCVGKSLEEIPEEHRWLVEQIRALGYGLGTGLSPFQEVMKWAKEHGRMPISTRSKEEGRLFARWSRTEEKEIVNKYVGKKLEEIPNDDERALVDQIRKLGYGTGTGLSSFEEVMRWAEEHRRMPKRTSTDLNEKRLAEKWRKTKEKKIVDDYEGKSIEEIEKISNKNTADLVDQIRKLGYVTGTGLSTFEKVMKWAKEHGRIPKQGGESKEERNLYDRWRRTEEKKIVDDCVGKSLEEIEEISNKNTADLVDQIRKLGYGTGTGLSAFEEVMKWAEEHGRIPKQRSESEEERSLYNRWFKTEEKKIVDDYAGKSLEDIEKISKEDRELVNRVRALGYGMDLSPFEEVMKWAKEHGRMPKANEKDKDEKNQYTRWWKTKEKKIVDDYEGKSLEEIEEISNKNTADLVDQIRKLGYGTGTGLSAFEEVMKWAEEHGRIPKNNKNSDKEESNLYRRWNKTKEKKIVDSYAGISIEEIEKISNENIAALVKKVRDLGYKGKSSKKIKTQDIAKNTYDALAPKCNEAAGVIEGLVQEKSEQDYQLKK